MMKERYQSDKDFPRWLKWLGGWRVNRDSIEFNWGYFAPRFGFEFKLHRGSYFDTKWAISFCPFWGQLFIKLPFDSGIESCNPPEYGIAIRNDTFWIYLGGEMDNEWNQCNEKWITWELPWFTWKYEFHHWQDENGKWIDGGWENKDNAYSEQHPYTYKLNSGEIQNVTATCSIEERQWHRKWFPWIKKNIKTLDVEFSEGVGEGVSSWKGGTVGCGYEMKPGETILQTLRRMEKERKL